MNSSNSNVHTYYTKYPHCVCVCVYMRKRESTAQLNGGGKKEEEKKKQPTVFESNSWCGWARTLSTLAASANVTNPKPLWDKKNETQHIMRWWGEKEEKRHTFNHGIILSFILVSRSNTLALRNILWHVWHVRKEQQGCYGLKFRRGQRVYKTFTVLTDSVL